MSDLIVPDKNAPRVLSLDEARAAEQNDPTVPELDRPNAFVTRAWALEVFAKVATNMTEQLYEQFGYETAQNLAKMEHIVTQRVTVRVIAALDEYMADRKWYRRLYRAWRAWLIKHGAIEKPAAVQLLQADPKVNAVDQAGEPLADAPDIAVHSVSNGA